MGRDPVSVLLYSAGLDSYCLDQIHNPDKRLFIDVETDESARERELLPEDVEVVEGINLSQFELDDRIIPHRNTIFAFIGSIYGNEILLGGTTDDSGRDTDTTWRAQTEAQLNYFAGGAHRVPDMPRPYRVRVPASNMTKAELVAEYFNVSGRAIDLFEKSRSCYEGGELECGQCRSCLRKAVALENNGVFHSYWEEYFERNPLDDISIHDHSKMLSRSREKMDYVKTLSRNPEYNPVPQEPLPSV